MKVELCRSFEFSAAHRLTGAGEGHRCAGTHGHNFSVEIAVRGEVDPRTGWLVDFGDLKSLVAPLIARLDHALLNEIPGLENPTSENIARWIWQRLTPELPQLWRVTVSESPGTRCSYWGED
jgi:6-pyruvoyltetrahydropterin/6-carboxytetrahydropterin synthase